MDSQFVLGLLHNIALLLAAGVIFDHYWKQNEMKLTLFKKIEIGLLLSAVGIILMLTPWILTEGLVFDGRSILLSVSGLFFGTVPTLVAMLATALYRIYAGGSGMWMGVAVIISAGSIGILWNHFSPEWQNKKQRYLVLALMGILVHIVMVGCTAFLPASIQASTVKIIILPTLIIYPLGVFLFGFFLLNRLKHWQTEALLKANEERFRLFYENAPVAYHSLDEKGRVKEVNQSWLQMLGYAREEVIGKRMDEFLLPSSVDFWHKKFDELLIKGRVDNLDFSFLTKSGEEIKVVSYGRVSINKEGKFMQTHSVIYNITERKRTEENIKKLNKRLTLAAKAARFGVWEWDIQSNRLEWDDTMYELYGIKKEDFAGNYESWLSLVHPDEREQNNEILQKTLLSGNEYDSEFRVMHKDGTEKLIRALGMVTRNTEGEAVRITGINYDITQRRSDEERLRDALNQLEVIAYNLPNVLWKADVAPDGSFMNTYISPVIDEFLKLPRNTINNDWGIYFSYVKPGYMPGILQGIRDGVMNPGKVITLEYEVNLTDGSTAWFLSSGRAYTSGNIPRLFGYTTNITARKQAEQKVAESERLLRSYIEGAPDAILIYDEKGLFSLTNRSATELTGYSSEELGKMKASDLITPDTFEKAREMSESLEVTAHITGEIELAHKNGIHIPVIVSAVKIHDKKILAFVKDITTIKQTQAELIQAKEKAEESNRLKSAFLATMSHELRTPLNAIIGFSALTQDETDIESIYENAAIIKRSGEQLLSIIESVFEMALFQSGKNQPVITLFNVGDLMNDLVQMAQVDKIKKGKEELLIKTSPDHRPGRITIRTDRSKLMQLLGNLVNNAIKYTREGFIEIGFLIEGNDISFYVKDTGIGIPSDKHQIIFEQFRQADDSHTRLYGGVGLGLSICDEIAHLLGGILSVESAPGQGSTFRFKLPGVVEENPAAGQITYDTGRQLSFGGKTILLVDDLDDNLYLLELMLSNTGATLLKAIDGKMAIDIVRNNPEIDVVLMDIKMPEMDGFDAMHAIHAFRPGLPVVAQTAFAIPGDREKALQEGCIGYLAKPIRKENLMDVLKEVFEKQQNSL